MSNRKKSSSGTARGVTLPALAHALTTPGVHVIEYQHERDCPQLANHTYACCCDPHVVLQQPNGQRIRILVPDEGALQ